MHPRVRSLAVAATALLAAGCLTLEADVAIGSDDTVSGDMSFTVDLEALQGLGEMGDMEGMGDEELFSESDVADVEQQLPASTNAQARLIEDETRVGLGVGLDGTPIAELPALFTALEDEGEPFPLRFTVVRDGELHRLSGTLEAGGPDMAMAGGVELDVSVTFAGEVQETNGMIGEDGRTVTWTAAGPMSATAEAGGGGGSALALIVGGVIALLVIVGVVVLVARSRRSSGAAAPQPVAAYQPGAPQQQPQPPAPPQASAPQQQPQPPAPPQAAAPQQPAGWYPDPWGQAAQRWWDGSQWTGHTG